MSDVWDKVKLNAKITRLREENARLREALKPFADRLEHYENYASHSEEWLIPLSAVRAAAAAIREGKHD